MITPLRVAVCITTYRRPAQLRELLQSLQALAFRKIPEPAISIVIVDNDPEATARSVFPEFLSRRYRIRYRIENRRGISYARNTAIESARPTDFIAFLDDDEIASPEWLDELLAAQSAYSAPIVAGPVLPQFEVSPPDWLCSSRFFQRHRHPTGTKLACIGTGNVLIASSVLQATAPLWFDPRYAVTGGEDTHFFRRCASLGFPVTWANDAVAFETVPAARACPGYLVDRARSGANQWTRVDLDLSPTWVGMSSRFAVGIFRLLQGSAIASVAPVLSPRNRLRGRLLRAEGIGNLNAFFGRSYSPYASTEP